MQNNNKYLLTVSIPTFNRSKELENCLTTLSKQTYKNFIINICDNHGSNSKEIKEIVKKHSNDMEINYLRNDSNIGHIRNFIKLLFLCKTKYHIWVADDDTFKKNYFHDLIEIAELDFKKKQQIVVYIPSTILNYSNAKKIEIKQENKKIYNFYHFMLLGFPISKNQTSYFWKNGIYGLFNTEILKLVITDIGEWVSERDLLMCCMTRGGFRLTDKAYIEKTISNEFYNLDQNDPFYNFIHTRFSFTWMINVLKGIKGSKFQLIFILLSLLFGSYRFLKKNIVKNRFSNVNKVT